MLSVTYGYARVSKADDDARNLETQLRILDSLHPDVVFAAAMRWNVPRTTSVDRDQPGGCRQAQGRTGGGVP